MAKKFGKFLLATAAISAVAAGVYYYLQGKDDFLDDDFEDDDDFDNFDEDLDEEDTADKADGNRNYVDLGTGTDFKEGLEAGSAEPTDKVVGDVSNAAKEDKTEEVNE